MFDRDYMMRMISQMAAAMGRVMGLKEQKKHEEALLEIDEFLSKELRMRTRLALGLSDEDLVQMLSVGGTPNYESVAIVATFLQEEGDILSETGRTADAVPRFEKALRLMLYVLRENGPIKGFDLEDRAERLLGQLAAYETSVETKRAAFGWRESEGRFADAEDLLYELYDHQGVTPDEGPSFYERLERKSDSELENGGLPRPELREGRRQWDTLAGETTS